MNSNLINMDFYQRRECFHLIKNKSVCCRRREGEIEAEMENAIGKREQPKICRGTMAHHRATRRKTASRTMVSSK